MTVDPVTITLDDRLAKVREIFESHQFHHLLVTDNKKLVGIISDRDYLKAISPNVGKDFATQKEMATLNKRVHQIMAHKLVTVRETDSLQVAIDKFRDCNVSCLPVIDDNEHVAGIFSWRNLLDAMRVKKA